MADTWPCPHNPRTAHGYGYNVAQSGWGTDGNGGSYDRWGEPTSLQVRKDIQYLLRVPGWYVGPYDGIWGPNSIKAIQSVLKHSGYYSGPIDGIPGASTTNAVGHFACDPGKSQAQVAYYKWNLYHTLDNHHGQNGREHGDKFWYAMFIRLREAWG